MSKQPNTRNNLTLYLTVALIAHQVFEGETRTWDPYQIGEIKSTGFKANVPP